MYEEYRHLAAALDLRMQPPDPGMMTFSFDLQGELDGQPVNLHRVAGRGAHFIAKAPLRRHLDLGLGIGRTGVLWHISEWLGAREIEVGDPAFDEAFVIRGDEPSRVTQLLAPEVRAALSAVHGDFELTDAHISLRGDVSQEDVPTLERALRDVVRVARAIDVARLSVPPATALVAHHAGFIRFAEEHRFVGEATPLWMNGQLGRYAVIVRARRKSAREFLLELSMFVEERWQGTSFVVQPRRGLVDRLLASIAKTGDDEFDRVFDLTTATPLEARQHLDDDVRRRLVALSTTGRVFADPGRVSIELDAETFAIDELPRLVEESRIILDALAKHRQAPGPAYR